MDRAEARASPGGREVLALGREVTQAQRRVIRGSCWTFVNTVYKEAGYGGRQRVRVFRSKSRGPYVDADVLQPGDFLSYINHSYNRGVHSAIFVDWLDRPRREALMLSYVGGNRSKPGGYRSYLLTHVYSVIRPK